MSHPDVVYVVRPGERNEELRYSLRSLQNLPHGRVWIAGHCPKWVQGVEVIRVSGQPPGRAQAKANLRAACEHPDVSEEFVYMCDDFFVMQPMERLPRMHRGPVSELVNGRTMASTYTRALERTARVLIEHGISEPVVYDLHAPMLVTKRGMLEALALCETPHMHELTLFGNLNRIGGERRQNHKAQRRHSGYEGWPFLSTNDSGFATLPVGRYIRSRFPDQSPYEASPPPAEPIPAPPRTPVRYRARVAA